MSRETFEWCRFVASSWQGAQYYFAYEILSFGRVQPVYNLFELFGRFDPNDLKEMRLRDIAESTRYEAEGTKSRLSLFVCRRVEGRGNGGFDNLAKKFGREGREQGQIRAHR